MGFIIQGIYEIFLSAIGVFIAINKVDKSEILHGSDFIAKDFLGANRNSYFSWLR